MWSTEACCLPAAICYWDNFLVVYRLVYIGVCVVGFECVFHVGGVGVAFFISFVVGGYGPRVGCVVARVMSCFEVGAGFAGVVFY